MTHKTRYIYTQIDTELGGAGIVDAGGNVIDYQIVTPPGNAGVAVPHGQWRLMRIAAVLNSPAGGGDPSQPSTDTATSLRSYFLPYTKRVCELEGLTVTGGRYAEVLRTTPRIPIVGWYPGDAGEREVNDTNFGEGHTLPRETGGDYWAFLLTSLTPAGVTELWTVTTSWELCVDDDLEWRL